MDFRSSGLCLRGIFDNIEVIGRGEGAADSLPAIYISMLVGNIIPQCKQNLNFTTVASCARRCYFNLCTCYITLQGLLFILCMRHFNLYVHYMALERLLLTLDIRCLSDILILRCIMLHL